MRSQILKNKRGHSTKAERRFTELLKKFHIPFRSKVKIGGHEVDFLIGNLAVEIDGHDQNPSKNHMLMEKGYAPVHFNSWEIPNPHLEQWLKDNGRNIFRRNSSHDS